MSINTGKLSRLSRYKFTGNILIFISFSISFAFFLGIFASNMSTLTDRFFSFGTSLIFIFLTYLFHRNLRKPYFSVLSQYIRELTDRRLDTQQVAVKSDLINPMQKISDLDTILHQIDELSHKMKNILNQTAQELNLNVQALRAPRIQTELHTIARLAKESLEDVERKRNNILFLAKTKQIVLNTIQKKIVQPKNEVEADYLIFKAQKIIKDQIIDDILIKRILSHALKHGEIKGELKHNNEGELVLTLDNTNRNEMIREIYWIDSEENENHCVICRHAIKPSEPCTTCPTCQNVFHRSHLLEWLKVFNQCPICHERITLFSES